MNKIALTSMIYAAYTAQSISMAVAQEADGEQPTMLEVNSKYCNFTFFSDGDDILDLRDSVGSGCFDLRGGRDIFALDPDNFPDGVQVYTGPGRDVVLTGSGNDEIHTFDDTDEEFVLRSGNDLLRIDGMLAEGGDFAGKAPLTKINMGDGSDTISFGFSDVTDHVRLRSPNLLIGGEGKGELALEGYCGRHFDDRLIDMTFVGEKAGKSLNISSDGCGLAFVDQSTPLNLVQKGSKLNLSVRPAAFESADTPVLVNSKTSQGAGLAANFETTSPLSSIRWGGFGLAAISANFASDLMGGNFDVSTSKSHYASISLSRGNADFDLAAGGIADVTLIGALGANSVNLSITAPSIRIAWEPSIGRFPDINTSKTVSIEALVGKEDASEEDVSEAVRLSQNRVNEAIIALQNAADNALPDNRDEASTGEPTDGLNVDFGSTSDMSSVFYSIASASSVVENRDVETGVVAFEVIQSNRSDVCYDLNIGSMNPSYQRFLVACGEELSAMDVSAFDYIDFVSGAHEVRVDINGLSDFQVDVLSVSVK